jgi:hypothetical protein
VTADADLSSDRTVVLLRVACAFTQAASEGIDPATERLFRSRGYTWETPLPFRYIVDIPADESGFGLGLSQDVGGVTFTANVWDFSRPSRRYRSGRSEQSYD